MKRILISTTTILFLLLTFSSPGSANFADSYGFSTKGISLGNAMCARVNDWSSTYYNIAGLGKSYGNDKYNNQLGFAHLKNIVDLDIDINRTYSSGPMAGEALATDGDKGLDTGTIVLGLAIDVQQIFLELPFVSTVRFGLAIGLNDDLTASKINDLDPRTHNFMKYGRETQNLTVMQGCGFGFLDDTVGFGLGVQSSFGGEGQVLLEVVKLESPEQTPVANQTMDMQIEHSIITGFYFSPGKKFDSMEGLEFGLSFRQESELDIAPFKTASVTDVGQIPLDLYLAMQDFYQPNIFTFGVAYEFSSLQISMDVEYQTWSDYEPSPAVRRNFRADLKDFDDIIIPRIGVEKKLSGSLSLLGGYYYEPSFVPDDAVDGTMNFLDNDKHVGSMGISYVLPPKFTHTKGQMEIVAGCQIQYMDDRDISKAAPTSENPDYSYGGMAYSFMIGGSLNL